MHPNCNNPHSDPAPNPQAREVVGEGATLDGLWAVYSINKEDIGVTFAPHHTLKR